MGDFKIGDFVFFDYGYGRIVAADPTYRTGSGITPIGVPRREAATEPLYRVAYHDPVTGFPVMCPDERCQTGCVICTRTLWGHQLRPMPPADFELFVREGLIKDKE